MKPKHYRGMCRLCKKRKEAKNTDKWTCKTWEECYDHPPIPTPGNFDIFEVWDQVVGCVKGSGLGPSGFDILAVREVVLLNGLFWDDDMLRRVRILEQVYLSEVSSGN